MKTISILLLALLTFGSFGCGYGTHSTTPPSAGVQPNISQLSPNNMTAGGTAFTLTVNGANFASNAAVNWNGTAQTTTFLTASQVTAAIPATAIATAGTATVSVTNPATPGGIYGGGTLAATSNSMTFTIN